jgi:hypothetical protein
LIGYELARFLGRNAASRTALLDMTSHPVEQVVTKAGGPVLLSPLVRDEATSGHQHAAADATAVATPADLLAAWRNEFAYIVIASSAAKDLYKLVDILPSVDASYLVVEAGRTRRATATSTIDLLRSYGVSGLQLILNKRVFFVPEWIVRHI